MSSQTDRTGQGSQPSLGRDLQTMPSTLSGQGQGPQCNCFPLFLCIVHLRFSYLSLLFGTLHSDEYIFPFLLAFLFSSFLSFSQLLKDKHAKNLSLCFHL